MNTIKFCLKCGNSIGPEEKFCGSCGASVAEMERETNMVNAGAGSEQSQQGAAFGGNPFTQGETPNQNQFVSGNMPNQGNSMPGFVSNAGAQAVKQPNPIVQKIKTNPLLAVIPAAALILVIVGIIVLCNILKYQVVSCEDIFTVTFEGVEGYGTAEAKLDYDKIDKLKLKKADNSLEEATMKLALYSVTGNGEQRISAEIDKKENLKNGDTVKVTVTYNKDYLKKQNIKLKDTEFDVEVTELAAGEEIDFFKGLKVTFEGNDGRGYADVDTSDAYDFIYFDYDYSSSLSNGDTYTVTAQCAESFNKAGDSYWFKHDGKYYVCKEKSQKKDYKVEGLDKLKEIDAFENIKFETKGAVPFLIITGVDAGGCSETVQNYVNFSVDGNKLYKAGDKVTVTASGSHSLEDKGFMLKETTKEIEIKADETASYVTSENTYEAAESLKGKIDLAVDKFKNEKKNQSSINDVKLDDKIKSFDSVTIKETFYSYTKETEPSFNRYTGVDIDKVNSITQVYEVKVTNTNKKTENFFIAVEISNVIKNGDEFIFGNGNSNDVKITAYKSISDVEAAINSDNVMTHEKVSAKQSSTESSASDNQTTSRTTSESKQDSSAATTSGKEKNADNEKSSETTTMVP